ncbi:aryl-sulfate sulfotransferase [candidate division KSB1 bacterium]|nr:aryl-sulfate sulfotransferase [candidate division KSB1 bacterium]
MFHKWMKVHSYNIQVFQCLFIFVLFLFGNVYSKIIYTYPLPDSKYVNPKTNIIIRKDNDISYRMLEINFNVSGSKSGQHKGRVILSDDNKTLIFEPDNDFSLGEMITVRIQENTGEFKYNYFTSNYIKIDVPVEINNMIKNEFELDLNGDRLSDNVHIINGISVPSDFPLTVIDLKENPASGNYFVNTWNADHNSFYVIIFDEMIRPVYYKKTPSLSYDFKLQPTNVLTHYVRSPVNGFVVMDSTYTVIDTIRCGNGHYTNDHELLILPDEHCLLIGNETLTVDLNQVVEDGHPSARVHSSLVQELDSEGNVVLEWRCWDHYDITDAVHEDLTAPTIDFTHVNAIDLDVDGNILVSCRNLSEVTKIDRQTGELIWRFGGVKNQFTFLNDPEGFSYQHCIRSLSNGNYLLFDNGNHRSSQISRVVEYELDEINMTALKRWEYDKDPPIYTHSWGSVQKHDNGNVLINWAGGWGCTEVSEGYEKLLEWNFTVPTGCYRVFKYPWEGKARAPYLITEYSLYTVNLIFNKFGDLDVDHYNIYGGLNPNPQDIIATSVDPYIQLANLENGREYFLRVTAVDESGDESDFSNEESINVNLIDPGDNIVVNGDFHDGFENWQWIVQNDAVASKHITADEMLQIQVNQGGSRYTDIQVLYPNIPLVQGIKYLFEFDAYSESSRVIEAEVRMEQNPWTNYSKKGMTAITQFPQHFSHEFIMDEPSDPSVRIAFNVGGDNNVIFIDNVSLKQVIINRVEDFSTQPGVFNLNPNYPNPFNPDTYITYEIPESGSVQLTVYDITGREVRILFDGTQSAGNHEAHWDGRDASGRVMPSGIYISRLMTESSTIQQKMMLMK